MWFFFFKQKTAYDMRISDWSSDVCSSDLCRRVVLRDAPNQTLLRVIVGGAAMHHLERECAVLDQERVMLSIQPGERVARDSLVAVPFQGDVIAARDPERSPPHDPHQRHRAPNSDDRREGKERATPGTSGGH